MTCQEILDVVDSMSGLLGGMAGYLLEGKVPLLEPACIYMDLKQNGFVSFIIPFAEKGETDRQHLYADSGIFLEHVDHREEKAVSSRYQFYKMSKAESFTIESFRALLEKEGVDRPDTKTGKQVGKRAGDRTGG